MVEQEDSFHYPHDKIVYLSADGDETLEDLKKDEIYIIGGIVDRNRYKFLTLEKAKRLGFRCAKLPLELVKFHGSRVLTVNNGREREREKGVIRSDRIAGAVQFLRRLEAGHSRERSCSKNRFFFMCL